MNECLMKIGRGSRIVLSGDMNGREGNSEVVGKWSINRVHENGEDLVVTCAEWGLFLASTFIHHTLIHRYTWRRRDE